MLLLWAPFTRPTPQDAISLSYSHRILQGILDFSLSQEHIPPAHPPKHALKSRDALPVNHTSHEAVGRRARWGTLFHAMGWKALRQRKEVRGGGQTGQTQGYAVLCRGLPKSSSQNQERADRRAQELNPKWRRNTSQEARKKTLPGNKWMPSFTTLLIAKLNVAPPSYRGLKEYLPKS